MKESFVIINRNIVNWEWYQDHKVFKIFIHCLINANWTERKWMGYVLERSQFATSYDKLSDQTGLTYKEVRNCLARLEQSGTITKKTIREKGKSPKLGRGFTLITICNYDKYQGDLESLGSQKAPKGQPKGTQRAGTNNIEQDKQGEQDIIIRAASKNFELVMANKKYINVMEQKFNIDIEKLKKLYNEFNEHLILTSNQSKTETEYMGHFLNWYTKKYKVNRRTGKKTMQDRNAL